MATMKPEQILKKLKTLARTQKRLVDWVKNHKTDAWLAARKKIYKRAQEASRIARNKDWTAAFTLKERTEIKKLYLHIREDVLHLFHELDLIFMGKKSNARRAKSPRARIRRRNPGAR